MVRSCVVAEGLREEMAEICSPRLQHPAEELEGRKLPSVKESWPTMNSFAIFACTTVALFCIVTASWFEPQSVSVGSSVVQGLDTGPSNESSILSGLFGPQPHRTAFHFQPPQNWMNAPMYYKGFYHLFYQYNPYGAVWGNISWGHAVSKDLLKWIDLEPALMYDQWYDIGGVWSGSATIRSDGIPILLYTGVAEDLGQTQNMAVPADPSDPYLRKWVKIPENPLLNPPQGVGPTDFRDPSTAWVGEDGLWRMTVGAQNADKQGMALVYKSTDLVHWELEENVLNTLAGTGIWECVDFFPVDSKGGKLGLETSVNGPDVKHVVKVSSWDEQHDYYAVGSYDKLTQAVTPVNRNLGVIYGHQYDYGRFYASKSFYDPVKKRRINWAWVSEADSIAHDIAKGWASVQSVPRVVWLDSKHGDSLLQAPIEELKSLRGAQISRTEVELEAGSVLKMDGSSGGQLDVEVTFEYPKVSGVDDDTHLDTLFNCSNGGSAQRGVFGPFGLLVMADDKFQEQTAVYFYLSQTSGGQWSTHFCSDQSRSSLMEGVLHTVYQGDVRVLPNEDYLSVRVLVDHSIIESFVQGGRTAITARVYPTKALQAQAHVFLFNNGTSDITVRKIEIWKMKSADAQVENSQPLQKIELPAITEGIPQVDEPFLASHLASHHPASRAKAAEPAAQYSSAAASSLVTPVSSLLRPSAGSGSGSASVPDQ